MPLHNIFQVLEDGTLVIQNIIKSSEGVYLCTVRTQVRMYLNVFFYLVMDYNQPLDKFFN